MEQWRRRAMRVATAGLVALMATAGAAAAEDETGLDPDRPPFGRGDDDFGDLVAQSLAAVLVVLVLGGAAIYVTRKVLPRFGAGQGRRIRLVETVHLGAHKALHLVRVGDRVLLLGGTKDRMALLTDVTGSVPPETGVREGGQGKPRKAFSLSPESPDAEES